jgi:hypothetical protein
MEAVMKTIVPAALVIVLEAGFLFSIASLPTPPERIQAVVQVASQRAISGAAVKVPAPAKAQPAAPASRS